MLFVAIWGGLGGTGGTGAGVGWVGVLVGVGEARGALGLQAFERLEGAEQGPLEAGFVEREVGEGGRAFGAEQESHAVLGGDAVFIVGELAGLLGAVEEAQEVGLDAAGATEAPEGVGEEVDQAELGGGSGVVFVFKVAEGELVELGVLVEEDGFGGGESPWVQALKRTAALPWGVRGPVDFWALRRFAAILRSEDGLDIVPPIGYKMETPRGRMPLRYQNRGPLGEGYPLNFIVTRGGAGEWGCRS